MADILLRAAGWMGGADSDLHGLKAGEERHFFRGQRLKNVDQGDRVYFVEKDEVVGYAKFQDYAPRQGETMHGKGWWGAYVVTGPYVPIDPPVKMIEGHRGQWRARYSGTVSGLDARLRSSHP